LEISDCHTHTTEQAFNAAAGTYDADFTHSATGRMQRNIIWNYLDRVLAGRKKLNILEMNCGTGEDATWLASKGHMVTATDISERMLEATLSRSRKAGLSDWITTKRLNIAAPDSYPNGETYDLVLSNFGGFNCVGPDAIEQAFHSLAGLLSSRGRLVAVVMSRSCAWEWIYFLSKGKFSSAMRRRRKQPIQVTVGNSTVSTWYYSPAQLKKLSAPIFDTIKVVPVGFFLPPSYLEPYFSKRPQRLKRLNNLEERISSSGVLARFADHFIIDMEVSG
jgi:ubiquinone/menaquinone biosynthesis C-methylase UbiE